MVTTEGRANVTQINTAFVMVTDGFRRCFYGMPFYGASYDLATPRQRDFRDGARIVKKREMSYKTQCCQCLTRGAQRNDLFNPNGSVSKMLVLSREGGSSKPEKTS